MQVGPGDMVEVSGIFLPTPFTGFRAMRAGLVADTYLEAMSVTQFKQRYEEYVPLYRWTMNMMYFEKRTLISLDLSLSLLHLLF
jgi:DNA replicative helicase MCM subunit Mcm2 (Cdc46/Mcm family)